jgi:hypothetical protein
MVPRRPEARSQVFPRPRRNQWTRQRVSTRVGKSGCVRVYSPPAETASAGPRLCPSGLWPPWGGQKPIKRSGLGVGAFGRSPQGPSWPAVCLTSWVLNLTVEADRVHRACRWKVSPPCSRANGRPPCGRGRISPPPDGNGRACTTSVTLGSGAPVPNASPTSHEPARPGSRPERDSAAPTPRNGAFHFAHFPSAVWLRRTHRPPARLRAGGLSRATTPAPRNRGRARAALFRGAALLRAAAGGALRRGAGWGGFPGPSESERRVIPPPRPQRLWPGNGGPVAASGRADRAGHDRRACTTVLLRGAEGA